MIVFDYRITNADTGQKLVSARTTLISIDRDGKPQALPHTIRALFA